MKKRLFALLFGILFLFSLSFSSCNANQKMFSDAQGTKESETSYEAMIKELERQILLLQQSQNASDAENQKELNRLQNLLAQLKEEATDTQTETVKAQADSETDPRAGAGRADTRTGS